jgi:hypothetical protein
LIDKFYCKHECPKGLKQCLKIVQESESPIEAAMDMIFWVEECQKTCSKFTENIKDA